MRRALMQAVMLWGCGSRSEDCADLAGRAATFSAAAVSSRAMGCQIDDDCALLRAQWPCFQGCPLAVSVSGRGAAQAELDSLSESTCGGSACSINAGCEPVTGVRCDRGLCKTVLGVADGGRTDAGAADGGRSDAGTRDGGRNDGG